MTIPQTEKPYLTTIIYILFGFWQIYIFFYNSLYTTYLAAEATVKWNDTEQTYNKISDIPLNFTLVTPFFSDWSRWGLPGSCMNNALYSEFGITISSYKSYFLNENRTILENIRKFANFLRLEDSSGSPHYICDRENASVFYDLISSCNNTFLIDYSALIEKDYEHFNKMRKKKGITFIKGREEEDLFKGKFYTMFQSIPNVHRRYLEIRYKKLAESGIMNLCRKWGFLRSNNFVEQDGRMDNYIYNVISSSFEKLNVEHFKSFWALICMLILVAIVSLFTEIGVFRVRLTTVKLFTAKGCSKKS